MLTMDKTIKDTTKKQAFKVDEDCSVYEKVQQMLDLNRELEGKKIPILVSISYGAFRVPKEMCKKLGIEYDKYESFEIFSKDRANKGLIEAYKEVKRSNPKAVEHLGIEFVDCNSIFFCGIKTYDGKEQVVSSGYEPLERYL